MSMEVFRYTTVNDKMVAAVFSPLCQECKLPWDCVAIWFSEPSVIEIPCALVPSGKTSVLRHAAQCFRFHVKYDLSHVDGNTQAVTLLHWVCCLQLRSM